MISCLLHNHLFSDYWYWWYMMIRGIILRIHHSWIYQYTLWKSNMASETIPLFSSIMFPARNNLWFGGFSSHAWEHLIKSHCVRLMFPLNHQCRWSNLQQDHLRNIWLVVWNIFFSIYNQIYSTKWWGQFPCSGACWTSPKSQVRWDAQKDFLAVLKIRGDFCPPGKMMTIVFFLDMNLKIGVYLGMTCVIPQNLVRIWSPRPRHVLKKQFSKFQDTGGITYPLVI